MYAERSAAFSDECDTADDEFDIASTAGDSTPAQLLTRMVSADDDDGEREDDISESAMSIDRLPSTEPQLAAATHAVPGSGDTKICAERHFGCVTIIPLKKALHVAHSTNAGNAQQAPAI
ncbi:hypothetical protein HPB52_006097 [Rhipicephalus sanguineus]|uniref:Uncharacterized protein n=1 Tax=Rhipicephalus sanguineus TaxID=34632 RepID=A0A9D4PYH1_RHISA|nr:hypothetical protein HPB52_006097 [Rhipicephalus sanguineus]